MNKNDMGKTTPIPLPQHKTVDGHDDNMVGETAKQGISAKTPAQQAQQNAVHTVLLTVDGTDAKKDEQAIIQAAEILRNGGLVAFPTETVYGLGGNALDASAAARIYRAKGRPSDNPLIVHVANAKDAAPYCHITPLYEALTDAFCPGPLTMILDKKPCIPDTVTGGGSTVGIRIPIDPVAHAFLQACGVPVAAPSANLSGHPSPTTAQHVIHDLFGAVDAILCGGESQIGLESTVVKLDGEDVTILRPGGISYEQLCDFLGRDHVHMDPTVLHRTQSDAPPLAPGMKYKHYAPRAAVTLLTGADQDVDCALQALASDASNGILCDEERYALLSQSPAVVLSLGARNNPDVQAHRLFAALRQFDQTDVRHIWAPVPQKKGVGLAVYNRLMKAAGFCVVEAQTLLQNTSEHKGV